MPDRYRVGELVRTRALDPTGHTRLPRYARGKVGTIVEAQGDHPLPDERSRGRETPLETVYTVRFTARDLWGEGDHSVTVDLWETYLAPEGGTHDGRASHR